MDNKKEQTELKATNIISLFFTQKKKKKFCKKAGRHFGFLKKARRHQKGAGRRALQKRPRQNTVISHSTTLQYNRVRNKAIPFVRDMPKYLRTSQMSVHGYPADKSIFYCNFKLGFNTEVTRRDGWHVPCRHRSRRCLSCWCAARCSWSRSLLLFHPSVRAPLLGDNTRFSNPSASRGRPVEAVVYSKQPILAPIRIGF